MLSLLFLTYFENKESPIICFKYNKPNCSIVFKYHKLVTELDIENSIPNTWGCKESKYYYEPAGHIVTGDFNITTDSSILLIIC